MQEIPPRPKHQWDMMATRYSWWYWTQPWAPDVLASEADAYSETIICGSKRDSSATEVRPGFCSMVRLDRFLDRQGRFFSSCNIASSPDSGEDLIEDYPDETNTPPTRPRSKYGLCRKHRCARRPHIFEHGSNAGKPVHICGLFFKRKDNQRMCWHFEIVHRRVVQDLWPEQMRAKYAHLSGSVDRAGVESSPGGCASPSCTVRFGLMPSNFNSYN